MPTENFMERFIDLLNESVPSSVHHTVRAVLIADWHATSEKQRQRFINRLVLKTEDDCPDADDAASEAANDPA